MLTASVIPIDELALAAVRRNAQAFAEHAALLRQGDDAQDAERHVHQARVATRRLRAALRLFADVLPPEACGLRGELKWIANQLGPVRDLDVQLIRLAAGARSLNQEAALEPYAAWLRAERDRAWLSLCDALDSERFRAVRARLSASEAWEPASPPAIATPGERVEKAVKALRKAADNRHSPPAPLELHRVRIRAKRTRYTVEFFEDAYGKRATHVREAVERIQELLGGFQDSVVSRQRIAQAIGIAGGTWPTDTIFALGHLMRYESEVAERARREFPKTYKDAEKAWKRFDPSTSKLAIS